MKTAKDNDYCYGHAHGYRTGRVSDGTYRTPSTIPLTVRFPDEYLAGHQDGFNAARVGS